LDSADPRRGEIEAVFGSAEGERAAPCRYGLRIAGELLSFREPPSNVAKILDKEQEFRTMGELEGVDAMSGLKPKGFDYFAALCGVLFMLACVGSFVVSVDQLSKDWIMRTWLLFVASILIGWGINRIRTGRPDPTVGQDTINLVIAPAGTTFALIGLLQR
jgi:hypothetical protein